MGALQVMLPPACSCTSISSPWRHRGSVAARTFRGLQRGAPALPLPRNHGGFSSGRVCGLKNAGVGPGRSAWRSGRTRDTCKCRAASVDYYQVLGVPETASIQDIKRAFKQKAIMTHPDVNKAPDAADKFMTLKEAYQVLSDAKAREAYDRKRRFGSWADAETAGFRTGRGAYQRQQKQQDEDFYGLEDFFKDLEQELSSRRKKRGSRRAEPTIWEELAELGEEFVEFLEDSAQELERESSKFKKSREQWYDEVYSSAPPRTGQEPPPPPRNQGGGSSAPRGQPVKPPADDVEEELARLKREMGL